MTNWCTKDSHNETLPRSGDPTDYCLRPRKRSIRNTPRSSKRYSYASPRTHPNPSAAPKNKNICCQPCALDTTNSNIDGNTRSAVAFVSNGFTGQSTEGNQRKIMGRQSIQKGGLQYKRTTNRYVNWQDPRRLRGDFKKIPLGDRTYGQESTSRGY